MKWVVKDWRKFTLGMFVCAVLVGCIQFITDALWPTFVWMLFMFGFVFCAGRVDRERERLERKLRKFDRKAEMFDKQK